METAPNVSPRIGPLVVVTSELFRTGQSSPANCYESKTRRRMKNDTSEGQPISLERLLSEYTESLVQALGPPHFGADFRKL